MIQGASKIGTHELWEAPKINNNVKHEEPKTGGTHEWEIAKHNSNAARCYCWASP
jgi:hypothetical protein